MNAIQWAEEYLVSKGLTLTSQPECVRTTLWSCVSRFATSQGYIYLKETPKLLALEATITQILHDQFHASVPEVIAHNRELNCFLMKDAGRPLREILKNKFDVDLLCKAIDNYTAMQLSVADHVSTFLDIGVPDWRLDKIPDLFIELLSQKDLLIADGLSEIEINELQMLRPKISNLCIKLSNYSIEQTIVQPDFNDNNSLIDEISQEITFIDLGEIAISHPFFSIINFLHVMKKHHALTDKHDSYLKIKGTCLKNFINLESEKHVLEAFEIAHLLFFIYDAFGNYRLIQACGKERILSFQPGKLSNSLKALIYAFIVIDR